jgi:dihydrolipoamide dehydrogenase
MDKTAVRMEKGWIAVDDAFRTDEPAVYAVGDAIGRLLLAHVAAAEGFIAAEAIAGKDPEKLDYSRAPRVTYSHPQVASVGFTDQQAKEAGHNAKSQRFSFKYNAMALIEGETDGFAKIVYDADSADLLGAHIIGPRAGELISEAAFARFVQASVWELGTHIRSHPTLSETLGEAAQLSSRISIYW